MPDVIFKKIIGGILIGIGCFVVGIINFIAYNDQKLFFLSLILSLGIFLKAWLTHKRFKNNEFIKIVGVCTNVTRTLFSSNKTVEILSEDETLKLYLPRETKISVNKTYAFYFAKKPEDTPVIINQYITSKVNMDNFLGCERMEDVSESLNE